METAGNETGDIHAKLSAAIERAKELCQRMQDQSAMAAKATDKAVREHPYQAIGVAFGIGLLMGVLVGRTNCE